MSGPAIDNKSAGIEDSGTQWSICACRSALSGMLRTKASAGSCTTVVPPARLIACKPLVPSSNSPVRTTPIVWSSLRQKAVSRNRSPRNTDRIVSRASGVPPLTERTVAGPLNAGGQAPLATTSSSTPRPPWRRGLTQTPTDFRIDDAGQRRATAAALPCAPAQDRSPS